MATFDHMVSHEHAPLPVQLLSDDGVAQLLGCSVRMVRKLVETRQIEVVKVGRLVRFEPAAVERYIEERRRPAI